MSASAERAPRIDTEPRTAAMPAAAIVTAERMPAAGNCRISSVRKGTARLPNAFDSMFFMKYREGVVAKVSPDTGRRQSTNASETIPSSARAMNGAATAISFDSKAIDRDPRMSTARPLPSATVTTAREPAVASRS